MIDPRPVGTPRLALEYVLPLRWTADADLDELTRYLEALATWLDVTVVDGSAGPFFEHHAERWAGTVRHVPPDPLPMRNGKVAGVLTGLRLARHGHVVLADDDVRYSPASLEAVLDRLATVDAVHPQNVYDSWPWQARWDFARTLINRAFGPDLGGTTAVRRDVLLTAGGYDGDVLFENLELLRTVAAAGGHVDLASDVLVDRRPPDPSHFAGQRVRQAYDDFAEPRRLAVELAILPLVVLGARRPWSLVAGALGAVVLAAWGRSRAGLARRVPVDVPLWAPVWLAERAVCVWVALALRASGGVPYAGGRVVRAASRHRDLAGRFPAALPSGGLT